MRAFFVKARMLADVARIARSRWGIITQRQRSILRDLGTSRNPNRRVQTDTGFDTRIADIKRVDALDELARMLADVARIARSRWGIITQRQTEEYSARLGDKSQS